jgi:hypothetical protein
MGPFFHGLITERWRSHQIKWCFSYTVFDITICGGVSSRSRTWGTISKLPRRDYFSNNPRRSWPSTTKNTSTLHDNATTVGIATNTIKRQRSRAMEIRYFLTCEKEAQKVYSFEWHPGMENLADYQSKHHPGAHHTAVRPYYLHKKNPPRELPRAIRPSTLKGCVGTLKDGYLRNVPLPRVPRIQSAKLIAPSRCIMEGTTPSRCIPVGTPLPEYLPISKWIPTLPKLGSLLGFRQRVL